MLTIASLLMYWVKQMFLLCTITFTHNFFVVVGNKVNRLGRDLCDRLKAKMPPLFFLNHDQYL